MNKFNLLCERLTTKKPTITHSPITPHSPELPTYDPNTQMVVPVSEYKKLISNQQTVENFKDNVQKSMRFTRKIRSGKPTKKHIRKKDRPKLKKLRNTIKGGQDGSLQTASSLSNKTQPTDDI